MVPYDDSVIDLIKRRFSTRAYAPTPFGEHARDGMQTAAASLRVGPLGCPLRFSFISATDDDAGALRGLGAYGSVKGATGFIVGAIRPAEKYLEDYGYAMEQLVLRATDLGLGSCWVGGIFTKSRFAKAIAAGQGEQIPAVTAVGLIENVEAATGQPLRQRIGATRRLPWASLFFERRFGVPLSLQDAGPYATPLEMVRLGPSASNKQPWRVVKSGNAFHFFLERTKGYGNTPAFKLMRVADIQRLDLGIAICHFELSAQALGLRGTWSIVEPPADTQRDGVEYTVSWVN
jgi:hypothetical protein